MRNVRCLNPKCGLFISGVWKNGAPARCPACGTDSHKILKDAVLAQMEQRKLATADQMKGTLPVYEN